MKAVFEEFIKNNPNCQKFENQLEARYIFESILSKDENIIAMVEASDAGKPALSACINEVEHFFVGQLNPEFDLTNNFTKQALGLMVKTILEPFGYTSDRQKDIPKSCNSKYVTSATVYAKTNQGKLKVVKKIEKV